MLSQSEENYLKCIFSLETPGEKDVSTNAIASKLGTKASSVSDMLKKLKTKKLVEYKKYYGASLSKTGRKKAAMVVRKHRLWEYFLVEKLNFNWDEVHDIAEQLEHIESAELVMKLDKYLAFPKYDPHGDPIPDENGEIHDSRKTVALVEMEIESSGIIVGVVDSSTGFLRYMESANLLLGTNITIKEIFDFDDSRALKVGKDEKTISGQAAKNIIVRID